LQRFYTHFAELGLGSNMVRIGTLLVMLVMATGLVTAQNAVVNSLTFTSGQYRLTLTAPTLGGDVSGTVLSTATGWALGGNQLVSPGPLDNRLGSLDAANVQLIAGGNTNVRLELVHDAHATLVPNEVALRFVEASPGTNYVGFKAAATTATYTVTLPATAPTGNQVLRANFVTPTNLEWATVSGGSGWALGGNAVTGAGNDNVLGTTTASPLRLAAGAVGNVRLEVLDAVNAVQLPTRTELRFGDDAGGEYVGLRAPAATATYTVDLPAAAPTTGQVLRATSATATEWAAPVIREAYNIDVGAVNNSVDVVQATAADIGVNDMIYVHAAALEANLLVGNARRTGLNQVTFRLVKTGPGGAVDPLNQEYVIYIVRVP